MLLHAVPPLQHHSWVLLLHWHPRAAHHTTRHHLVLWVLLHHDLLLLGISVAPSRHVDVHRPHLLRVVPLWLHPWHTLLHRLHPTGHHVW
jgi:hypothetical protein